MLYISSSKMTFSSWRDTSSGRCCCCSMLRSRWKVCCQRWLLGRVKSCGKAVSERYQIPLGIQDMWMFTRNLCGIFQHERCGFHKQKWDNGGVTINQLLGRAMSFGCLWKVGEPSHQEGATSVFQGWNDSRFLRDCIGTYWHCHSMPFTHTIPDFDPESTRAPGTCAHSGIVADQISACHGVKPDAWHGRFAPTKNKNMDTSQKSMVLLNPPDALTWESHLCFSGNFPHVWWQRNTAQARPLGHAKRSDLSSDSNPHRCSRCYHPTFGLSHGHSKSSLPMGSRKNQEPTHKNVRFLSSHCLVSATGYVSNFLPVAGVVIEICPMTKFLGPFAIIYQWWNFPWPWPSG